MDRLSRLTEQEYNDANSKGKITVLNSININYKYQFPANTRFAKSEEVEQSKLASEKIFEKTVNQSKARKENPSANAYYASQDECRMVPVKNKRISAYAQHYRLVTFLQINYENTI